MIRNADHWRIETPRSSHYRTASCAEVNCVEYFTGFQAILANDGTREGLITFIRRSKMDYTEERMEGNIIVFTFPKYQECFKGQAGEHKTNLERDPIFKKNGIIQEVNQWQDGIGESLYRLGRQ